MIALYLSELERWVLHIYQYRNNREMLQTSVRSLTVRDRILLHLATFELYETDHWSPTQVSQKGIAKAVGILQRHIPQYVRPMVKEGLVEEHSSYIQGGKQHQKVYFLTNKGRTAASWMHDNPRSQTSDENNEPCRTELGTNSKTTESAIKKARRFSGRTERTSFAR